MARKARWNLTTTTDDSDPMQDDPLANAQPIQLVGRSDAEMTAELSDLVSLESYLYRIPKIRCKVKQEDTPVTAPLPCPTCPHFTANPDDPMSRLCTVGRRQAAVIMEMEAHRTPSNFDAGLAAALELADHVEAEELAEALLA